MLMPLTPEVSRVQGGLARVGLRLGDLLRLGARTGRETLPRPRKIGVTETLTLASVVRRDGLRGGAALLGRPARGRRPARARGRPHRRRPRCPRAHPRAGQRAHGHRCRAHRQPHRRERAPSAPAPSSTRPACGPATSSTEIRLRPSRGTHVVLRKDTLPGVRCAIMAPVPGREQPLRVRPPAARRDLLRRPDRRGGRRRSPTCPSRRRRTSSSCCACSTPPCARTYAATRSSGRTPDCVPCSTRGAPPPTSRASTRCSSRAPVSSPSSAAS